MLTAQLKCTTDVSFLSTYNEKDYWSAQPSQFLNNDAESAARSAYYREYVYIVQFTCIMWVPMVQQSLLDLLPVPAKMSRREDAVDLIDFY